jgi:long-chain acyl-CoA synthetase
LGERPIDSSGNAGLYLFHSYAETGITVRKFASGLAKEELLGSNDDGLKMLGIFMKNSSYWIVAEQACFYLGALTVPLYESTGKETLEFILNETALETVVCSESQLRALVNVASLCPSLKTVVVTSLALSTEYLDLAKSANLSIVTVYDIERIGEAFPAPPRPPEPDSLATLCYTSGTTGKVGWLQCVVGCSTTAQQNG